MATSPEPMPTRRRAAAELGPALVLAAAGLLIQLLTNGGYGIFRDELLYLAAAEHLDWGYVDHAPLIALVTWFSRHVFGESLRGLRFLPALAGAAAILLTGLIARQLGGRRWAVALASLAWLLAPMFLIVSSFLSMNVFEPLLWMGCAYVAVVAIRRNDPRLLIWFGVFAGASLMNKHSTLFFGAAFAGGLLLTSERRWLGGKWLWIAGLIALLLFLPNLLWQYQHGWPTIEDLSNVRRTGKNVELSPIAFLGQQAFIIGPLGTIAAVIGLWFLFFDPNGKRFRLLGWTYLLLLAIMMTLKGKHYYLGPVYPMLVAAGAVAWERAAEARRAWRWAGGVIVAVCLLFGVISAPLMLPILPPATLVRYSGWLGIQAAKTEVGHIGVLPQHFGDRFGWPETVETVARVYNSLPSEERAKACIAAGNYGEAGAIDFFGPRYGLPKAISGHQTYFFWGPRDCTGEVLILLQADRRRAEQLCARVEESARVGHPYAMAEENYVILICRGLKMPLGELWPRVKHWN